MNDNLTKLVAGLLGNRIKSIEFVLDQYNNGPDGPEAITPILVEALADELTDTLANLKAIAGYLTTGRP